MNIKCCFQCAKRHIGCHSECPDYIAERKALDEKNALMFKERCIRQNSDDQHADAVRKASKRKR